jgi:putative Holliday junction resolvase
MANNSYLALDVGDVRIGVAVANAEVRFPRPLTTLLNDDNLWPNLEALLKDNDVIGIVVGLPRNLSGDATDQTRKVEAFVEILKTHTNLPISFQDEATTSVKAEAELRARGKPYEKADIDALAATYILEDYLVTAPEAH